MRRTEDEFRKSIWVDILFLSCFVVLGATLLGIAMSR